MLYIGLELLGSLALQYLPALVGYDQELGIAVRLLELAGFIFLVRHFCMVDSLGLSMPRASDVRIFMLFSVMCILLAGALYLIQPSWFYYITTPSWIHGLSGLLLMVVLAPVVEELVFRGLLYRMLREQWGIAASVAVSAILFSLMHQGIIVSPQLAGGIIFALAYEWSRSLWVSIALHMGANGAVYSISLLTLAV